MLFLDKPRLCRIVLKKLFKMDQALRSSIIACWTTSHSQITRPGKRLQKAMENHHVLWENSLFQWPFSMSLF